MATPTTSQAKKSMFTAPAAAPQQQPVGAGIVPPPGAAPDMLAMLQALKGGAGGAPNPRDQLMAEVVHGRHLGMGGGVEGNSAGPTGGDPFTNGFFKPTAERQGLQTTMPSTETLAQAFAAPQPGAGGPIASPALAFNTGVPMAPGLFPAGPQTQEGMTPFGPVQSNPGPLAPKAPMGVPYAANVPPGVQDPRFSRGPFTAPARM